MWRTIATMAVNSIPAAATIPPASNSGKRIPGIVTVGFTSSISAPTASTMRSSVGPSPQ